MIFDDKTIYHPIEPIEAIEPQERDKLLNSLKQYFKKQLNCEEMVLIKLVSSGRFTYQEIGDILLCSPKTAHNKYNAAVSKMSAQVK